MAGPKIYQRGHTFEACPKNHYAVPARGIMDKYIGFDVHSNKTSVCIVQKGEAGKYATTSPEAGRMRNYPGPR